MTSARRFVIPAAIALLALAAYLFRVHKILVDFEVYRTAAERVLQAAPLFRPEDGHYQYKYFPLFAFVMTPFALMAHQVARPVWFVLTIGFLAVFLRLSVSALPDRRKAARGLLWLTVLCTGKFWVKELAFGQTNVLLGLALLGALLAARHGRRWLAGGLIGLAIFVKPYALLFVPWLAWTEGLTALAGCALVLTAGLVLPAIDYGWQGNMDQLAGWFQTVTSTTGPNLLDNENISLATMWAKWIGQNRTAALLGAASSAAALVFPLIVVAKRRDIAEPLYLELGVLMVLVPLLSPQGWDYVLLLGAPAFVCLIDRLPDLSLPWRAITLLAIFLVSFTIFDLVGRFLYTYAMSFSLVTVGALILLASLTHLRWKRLA